MSSYVLPGLSLAMSCCCLDFQFSDSWASASAQSKMCIMMDQLDTNTSTNEHALQTCLLHCGASAAPYDHLWPPEKQLTSKDVFKVTELDPLVWGHKQAWKSTPYINVTSNKLVPRCMMHIAFDKFANFWRLFSSGGFCGSLFVPVGAREGFAERGTDLSLYRRLCSSSCHERMEW